MKDFLKKLDYYSRQIHIGHVFGGIFGIIVIATILSFLFGWKAPISLNNVKDKNDIEAMLINEYPNCEFDDMVIKTVVFSNLVNTLEYLYPELSGELEYKTQTVFYKRITSNDTINCATIFEIKSSFLKDRVGRPLYHMENVYRHF